MVSNPRGNNIVRESVQKIGSNVILVSIGEAALTEIIILFVPRENLEQMTQILPDVRGKIILHTNNPFFCLESLASVPSEKSSSEILSDLLPGTHIIRLYNPLRTNPALPELQDEQPAKIFFEGINKKAKKNAKAFLETLHFSVLDLNEMRPQN